MKFQYFQMFQVLWVFTSTTLNLTPIRLIRDQVKFFTHFLHKARLFLKTYFDVKNNAPTYLTNYKKIPIEFIRCRYLTVFWM